MNHKQLAANVVLALGALVSNPASAVIVSGYGTAPGNLVTDYSSTGLVSFDLDLALASPPTTITFMVESGDIGGLLDFNAIVNNLFGGGISRFALALDNAQFASIGSVGDGGFGSNPSAAGGDGLAVIDFAAPEYNFFSIGDPFASGATDWTISIAGVDVGETFSLLLTVPEPGSLPLMLAGLAGIGALVRRGRAQKGVNR